VLAQLLEPPYTDPYVRWCGRGGAARLPPIPIYGTNAKFGDVRFVAALWGEADLTRSRQNPVNEPQADIGGSNIPHRSSLLPRREYAKVGNPAEVQVSLWSRLISLLEQLRLDLPEVAPERFHDRRNGSVNPARRTLRASRYG
jgi:hypothetical protein